MHIFLETDRLLLRRFTEHDAENLHALDSDPAVMRFLNGGEPTSRREIERDILPKLLRQYGRSPDFGCWATVEKATGDFVGWFALHPPPDADSNAVVELGYRLKKSAWGEGYATEGSRALIHRAFTDLGVERVFAQTMAVNYASRRVMEKAGLRHTRTFHEEWEEPIAGAEKGEVEYALNRDEWENRES